jgi:hypothetical protein
MDANNIFHGSVQSVTLDGTDMGVTGEASAEISFAPVTSQLGDGQTLQTYGTGKVVIELAETDTVHIQLLENARQNPAVLVITSLSGQTFTLVSMLLQHEIARPFSEGIHKVTVTGTKFAIKESDFVTIA